MHITQRMNMNMNISRSIVRWMGGLGLASLIATLLACGGGGGGGDSALLALPPVISSGPAELSVRPGQTASFRVEASSTDPLSYQWKRDGADIAGATASQYALTAALADDGARFSVLVSNSAGSTLSQAAWLFVNNAVNGSSLCDTANTSAATEPLFAFVWHIKNVASYFASDVPASGQGHDLCMGNVWADGITGSGVKVNVVDEGLEIAHEDFAGRIIADASFNFLDNSTNPTSTNTDGDHGTSVAGLISANYNNGVGGVGVAPSSGLMAYNFLENQSLASLRDSFGGSASRESKNADVFNFSAGSTSLSLASPNSASDAVLNNVTTLRGGKGAMVVKSAGNGFERMGLSGEVTSFCNALGVSCQNANQDTDNTAFNAIVVAALAADGKKSSYSTTGSPIWISGFGGEYGNEQNGNVGSSFKPAMLTADQSGCAKGYSRTGISKNSLDKGDASGLHNSQCNYTAAFNGTSSAAPTVSGVIALMLQANPNLTWRDVKHILASTARRVNPGMAAVTVGYHGGMVVEQPWVLNAAGYYFHNWFGFGLVNASKAVVMAKTHVAGSLGAYTSQAHSAVLAPTQVPKTSAGLTKTFSVSAAPSIVEQAEVMVHFGSGIPGWCNQIELTSPRGTKSILLHTDTSHGGSSSTGGVRLLSNAFYGERSAGAWSLKFINTCSDSDVQLSSTAAQVLTIRGRSI